MSNPYARPVIPACFWRESSGVTLRAVSYLKWRDALLMKLDSRLRGNDEERGNDAFGLGLCVNVNGSDQRDNANDRGKFEK